MLLRALSFSLSIAACALAGLSGPALAEDASACDPHGHWVAEKDDDQGAVMKRCVCDPGWESVDPEKPCRPIKQAVAKKPKPRPKK